MVAYYFPPLGGIGSLRAMKLATYLPESGWDVTVVAPRRGTYYRDPTLSFPEEKVVRTGSLELSRAGKAVLVPGTADTQAASVGPLRRLARDAARRWLYRPDPQIGWYPFAVRAGRRALREERFDAVFSSSFPITAHLVGRRLHRDSGLPWVAEFRDPWTDVIADGEPRKAREVARERSIVEEATRVVTVSEAWAALFRGKGARDVAVVTNGYDAADLAPGRPPDGIVVTYLGSFYSDRQDLSAVWPALRRIWDTSPSRRFRLRFVGDLDPGLRREIATHGLEEALEVTGFLPYREALARTADSSILLGAGARDERPILKGLIPAKLFEYLGTGLPILYVGDPGSDAALLLARQPGCFVVAPGDGASVERALRQALDTPRLARDLQAYTRRALAARLAVILDDACRR
jgi:glycosyltransferase involved in cell wall biosynthesis